LGREGKRNEGRHRKKEK
jgi:hypothetical protein